MNCKLSVTKKVKKLYLWTDKNRLDSIRFDSLQARRILRKSDKKNGRQRRFPSTRLLEMAIKAQAPGSISN